MVDVKPDISQMTQFLNTCGYTCRVVSMGEQGNMLVTRRPHVNLSEMNVYYFDDAGRLK